MIVESTLTAKNQTTVPKAVVESLGVKPSDKLVFEIHDGKVTLTARSGRLADLAGAFRRHFTAGGDFGDALILYRARDAGCTALASFDKQLQKRAPEFILTPA